jgi:hypothetical protein
LISRAGAVPSVLPHGGGRRSGGVRGTRKTCTETREANMNPKLRFIFARRSIRRYDAAKVHYEQW